jgi:hypothetical protein
MIDLLLAVGRIIVMFSIGLYLALTVAVFVYSSFLYWPQKTRSGIGSLHFFGLMILFSGLFPFSFWKVTAGKDEPKWLKKKFEPLTYRNGSNEY